MLAVLATLTLRFESTASGERWISDLGDILSQSFSFPVRKFRNVPPTIHGWISVPNESRHEECETLRDQPKIKINSSTRFCGNHW